MTNKQILVCQTGENTRQLRHFAVMSKHSYKILTQFRCSWYLNSVSYDFNKYRGQFRRHVCSTKLSLVTFSIKGDVPPLLSAETKDVQVMMPAETSIGDDVMMT